MKTKFLYIAALALLVSFTACENNTPFDTQTEDDYPIILKPYNESGTGSFQYVLPDENTPLVDSVTVTPSRYTTVNWYVNDELVHTGTKINMCFPLGKHKLVIEAVTTKGKRTERFGSITVGEDQSVLFDGSCVVDWGASNVFIDAATMAKVPLNATIYVEFEIPDADYHALRITNSDWSADIVPQIDGFESKASPFTFVYDQNAKDIANAKGMLVTGHGVEVKKVRFE